MEIIEPIEQIKEDLKSFKIQEFSWREFVKNSSGTPSAGLFIAFWYGCILVFLYCPFLLFLLIAHHVSALVSTDLISSMLQFVGLQVGLVLTYLGTHKIVDNNTLKINKTDTL